MGQQQPIRGSRNLPLLVLILHFHQLLTDTLSHGMPMARELCQGWK